MKKTIRTSFNRDGFLDTVAQRGLESFAGRKVTITVETTEQKQMCGSCSDDDESKTCDRPARWELCRESGKVYHRCNEHVWRVLAQGTYTITPIPPQPPEPVVVEGICDNRPGFCMQGAKGTPWYEFPVPPGLTGKRFKYRCEEIP